MKKLLLITLFLFIFINFVVYTNTINPFLAKYVSAQTPFGSVDFIYDANGQRLAKIEGGGDHTYYIGSLEITVKPDGSTSWNKDYGGIIREKKSTDPNLAGKLYFIYNDHLGSTSQVYDDQGNVVSNTSYFPYGQTRGSLGTLPTDRLYTGQVSDLIQTGLYYYNARYYNPLMGIFTQADQASDGLNKYAYVGGNPINKIDPTGNMEVMDWGGGGGPLDPPEPPVKECNWWCQLGNSFNEGLQNMTDWNLFYSGIDTPTYGEAGTNYSLVEGKITLSVITSVSVGGKAIPITLEAITACMQSPACSKVINLLGLTGDVIDIVSCKMGNTDSCADAMMTGPMGYADDMADISSGLRAMGNKGGLIVNDATGYLYNLAKARNMSLGHDPAAIVDDISYVVSVALPYNTDLAKLADNASTTEELLQIGGGVCRHQAKLCGDIAASGGIPSYYLSFYDPGQSGYHAVALAKLTPFGKGTFVMEAGIGDSFPFEAMNLFYPGFTEPILKPITAPQ